MEHDVKEVLKRIEELRRDLHEMLEEKGTQDPEVLAASQKLDKALNDYYRLLRWKKDPENFNCQCSLESAQISPP